MKELMNTAIQKMSEVLDCDYLFALGLFHALDEMVRNGRLRAPITDRSICEFGYMSTKMSRKMSTEKGGQIWDIFVDTMVDINRDRERDKKRTYRERKRRSLLSPLPSTPPIPPIIPPEKERLGNDIPPSSLRDETPKGVASDTGITIKHQAKRFVKPTLDELKAYADEIDYNLNAQAFLDYYDGNGWMAGRNHMKDWKATVRNWKRRDEERGKNTHAKPARTPEPELTAEQAAIIDRLTAEGFNYG